MNYPDGTDVRTGDTVKLADDRRFNGGYDSGNLLALCRYGTVLNTWPLNDQLSVRFMRIQDVGWASSHPHDIARSIFSHDAYVQPHEMTFIERGGQLEV